MTKVEIPEVHVRKGQLTRNAILECAQEIAERLGLHSVTLGPLAEKLGMSKSGLFAHYRSREDLLLAVLYKTRDEFLEEVFYPTLKEPRGLPRLRALLKAWIGRYQRSIGCIFLSAAADLDGRPGVLRDAILDVHKRWSEAVTLCIVHAQELGQVSREVSAEQLTYELYGVVLASHHYRHVLLDSKAAEKAETSTAYILDRHLVGEPPVVTPAKPKRSRAALPQSTVPKKAPKA